MTRLYSTLFLVAAFLLVLGTIENTSLAQTFDLSVDKLQKLDAQKSLLKQLKPDSPLAKSLKSWHLERHEMPAPDGALDLLTDSKLETDAITKQKSLNLKARELTRFMQRVSDPDIFLDNLQKKPPRNVPPQRLDFVKAELSQPAELNRLKTCGKAVQQLREPVLSDGIARDRIEHFEALCLRRDSIFGDAPLTQSESNIVTQCAGIYQDYLRHCMPDASVGSYGARLKRQTGILFVVSRAGVLTVDIVCSATLISKTRILTARHCLDHLKTDPKAEFRFIPFEKANEHTNSNSPIQSGIRIASIVTPQGLPFSSPVAITTFVAADDVVVLELQQPVNFELAFGALSHQKPTVLDRLVIVGFQRLAFYALQMRARLEGVAIPEAVDLIGSGRWTSLVLLDETLSCRALSLKEKELDTFKATPEQLLGHSCQSNPGGSGAALFSYSSDTNSSTAVIKGLHLAGKEVSDRILDGMIERTGSTNVGLFLGPQFASQIR